MTEKTTAKTVKNEAKIVKTFPSRECLFNTDEHAESQVLIYRHICLSSDETEVLNRVITEV